jgi:DeoR/GlpR family transcriptional regulator of sugar metabolism
MAAATRDEAVMDLLRSRRSASVAEIAATLDVAEATVRRRLHRLEQDGRLVRTYGGAVLVEGMTTQRPGQADPQLPYKRAIGLAASRLVEDGSTIALSSGTTVLEMARRLRERHLTVITNVLDIANALLDAPAIELVVVGGVVLPDMHSMRGHLTEEALRDLRADTVFMGASAIDLDNGFMTEQVREIAGDRAMRRIARDAVILADASKFDRMAPGFMFGFSEVGTVVTDERTDEATRDALEARGTRVVVGMEGGLAPDR